MSSGNGDSNNALIILVSCVVGIFVLRFGFDILEERGYFIALGNFITERHERFDRWRNGTPATAPDVVDGNDPEQGETNASRREREGSNNNAHRGEGGEGDGNGNDGDADSVDSEEEREYRAQIELAEEMAQAEFREMAQQHAQGRRCLVVMVLAFTLTGLLLLYLNDGMREGFWDELQQAGPKPAPADQFSAAYCEALDIALRFGGVRDGTVLDEIRVYDFNTASYYDLDIFDTEKILQPRRDSNLVSLETIPNSTFANNECLFLLQGGLSSENTGVEEMVAIRIVGREYRSDEGVEIELINQSGDLPEVNLFGGSCASRSRSLFVAGGCPVINGTISCSEMPRFIWGFKVEIDRDSGEYGGTWSAYDMTNVTGYLPRYRAVSAYIEDSDRWLLYGGYSEDQNDMLSSAETIELDKLSDGVEPEKAHNVVIQSIGQQLRRADSVASAVVLKRQLQTSEYLYVYGGVRQVESRGGIDNNPFVSVTNSNDNLFLCRTGSEQNEWCAFTTVYPGDSARPVGITRSGRSMVVWRNDGSLWQFDMYYALDRGSYRGGLEVELGGSEIDNLNYSLIGAAVFILLTLCVLYSHRTQESDFHLEVQIRARRRKAREGLSSKQLAKVPLVRWKEDGKHVPVREVIDEEGNVSYVDIEDPAESPKRKSLSSRLSLSFRKNSESQDVEMGILSPRNVDIADSDDEDDGQAKDADDGQATNQKDANDWSDDLADGECCGICILEFEEDDILRKLKCNHMFHAECVDVWIKKKGACPLCRQHVLTGKNVFESETTVVADGVEGQEGENAAHTIPVDGDDRREGDRRSRRESARRSRAESARSRRSSTESRRSSSGARRSQRVSQRAVRRASQIQAELDAIAEEEERENEREAQRRRDEADAREEALRRRDERSESEAGGILSNASAWFSRLREGDRSALSATPGRTSRGSSDDNSDDRQN